MQWTADKAARVAFWCGPSALVAALLCGLTQLSFWAAFLAAWMATAGGHLLLGSWQEAAAGKAVLISGCDSGFGQALALRLVDLGFRVFAGCLNATAGAAGADALRNVGSPRLHVLQLDITDQNQVSMAAEEVKKTLSNQESLWAIVNNAGISTFGAVEWTPMQTFKDLAEVNLFGSIRMIKTFLPLLRKSQGRVINVTSAEGRIANPMVSAYDLTKHAMEGFSDCLRNEIRRFGVHVCLVEPGNFTAGTSLNTVERARQIAKTLRAEMSPEVSSAYGQDYFDRLLASRESVCNSGLIDLSIGVETMIEALTQKFPQARYTCMDLGLYIRMLVTEHLPEWVHDYFYIGEDQRAFYT